MKLTGTYEKAEAMLEMIDDYALLSLECRASRLFMTKAIAAGRNKAQAAKKDKQRLAGQLTLRYLISEHALSGQRHLVYEYYRVSLNERLRKMSH